MRKNYLLNNLVFILKCHTSINLSENRKDAFGRIKVFSQERQKILQSLRLKLDKVKIGAFYLEKKLEIFEIKSAFWQLKHKAVRNDQTVQGAQKLTRVLRQLAREHRQKYS